MSWAALAVVYGAWGFDLWGISMQVRFDQLFPKVPLWEASARAGEVRGAAGGWETQERGGMSDCSL